MQKFNLAYGNISEDQYEQGIVGTELAESKFGNWIKGIKPLQSLYGAVRSIGTSNQDAKVKLEAEYI